MSGATRPSVIGILAIVVLVSGCSVLFPTSSFRPKNQERVVLSSSRGRTVLVKGGRTFPLGLGDGLVQAVSDDEQARDIACRYRRREMWTYSTAVLAVGCVGLSLAGFFESDDSRVQEWSAAGVALCTPMSVISVFANIQNKTLLYEAINIYNDRR
jgi:hypothetical protein